MWEDILCNDLLEVIQEWRRAKGEDIWWWKAKDTGIYLVSSAYKIVAKLLLLKEDFSRIQERVFASIQKSVAPSKVVAFSWQLLLKQILTKANHARRTILASRSVLQVEFRRLRSELQSWIKRVSRMFFRWMN